MVVMKEVILEEDVKYRNPNMILSMIKAKLFASSNVFRATISL
jgi:hypothetical protein